jgi:hypothetical protein
MIRHPAMAQIGTKERWRRFLYNASRSRSFLWKLAIGTLALSIGVGAALSQLKTPPPQERADPDRPRRDEPSPQSLGAFPIFSHPSSKNCANPRWSSKTSCVRCQT